VIPSFFMADYGTGFMTVVVPVVSGSSLRLAASFAATIWGSLSSLPQRADDGLHVETALRGGLASFAPEPGQPAD
jgi:hypothetical protein